MADTSKTKAQYLIEQAKKRDAARRAKAAENKAYFDLNQKIAPGENNVVSYAADRALMKQPANAKGEFLVGTLTPDEQKVQARAKLAALRAAAAKKK